MPELPARCRGCGRQVFDQGSRPARQAPRLGRAEGADAPVRAADRPGAPAVAQRRRCPADPCCRRSLSRASSGRTNTYPHLAPTTIGGNPEATSDTDLVASARVVLDEVYAAELERDPRSLSGNGPRSRAPSGDIVDVARAATFGAVDTVFVDIDEVVHGVDRRGVGRRHARGTRPTRSATASSTRSPAGSGSAGARAGGSAQRHPGRRLGRRDPALPDLISARGGLSSLRGRRSSSALLERFSRRRARSARPGSRPDPARSRSGCRRR